MSLVPLFAGLVFFAWVAFSVYFYIKQLEFVLVSVNLYRTMVRRQDQMVQLLMDIRDGTVKFQAGEKITGLDENRGGSASLAQLIVDLESPDATKREAAAFALGRLGGYAESAIPALTRTLEDEDRRVRTRSEWALSEIRRRR